MRNARVRNSHEPIAMINYTFDPNEHTQVNLATSLRFGKNGYSALTWYDGASPSRLLPLYAELQVAERYRPGGRFDGCGQSGGSVDAQRG